MLVEDELVDRTKNCCLTPVDFLEAVVRLADAMEGKGDSWSMTAEEAFEVVCLKETSSQPTPAHILCCCCRPYGYCFCFCCFFVVVLLLHLVVAC